MTAQILAIANWKGGVGKTTVAMALCQAWSSQGKKIVVLDIDPAGGVSLNLGVPPREGRPTIADVIYGRGEDRQTLVASLVESKLPGIWSLPYSPDLDRIPLSGALLRAVVSGATSDCDTILIDCQPAEHALTAPFEVADKVAIPMVPDENSVVKAMATVVVAQEAGYIDKLVGLVATNFHNPMTNNEKSYWNAFAKARLWVHRGTPPFTDLETTSLLFSRNEWRTAVRNPGYRVGEKLLATAVRLSEDIMTYKPPLLGWQQMTGAIAGDLVKASQLSKRPTVSDE